MTASSIGTVLILDDSLTVRMDLVSAFEEAGWQAAPCATAAAAWQVLATQAIDVIILDVLLPDADGVDVLRALRTDPVTAALPVLMLSSEAQVKDRIRGLRTGADEYVGKPYETAYLLARAQELIAPRTGESAGSTRILVISESQTVRQAMLDAVQDAGHQAVLTASGLEGLRLAAARRPDAVLVDGSLPDIDGASVIRRLRLDAALRAIPCLLLTGSQDVGMQLRALDAGADAFVRKDTDPAIVMAMLAAALRRAADGSPVVDTVSLQGPKKILTIGGEASARASLAATVSGEGYDVVLAATGEEAIELLAFQSADCILLSGHDDADLQVCRRVKAVPAVRDVPLIVMAAGDDQDRMVEALAAGADDYVSTLGDPAVLAARIRAQLRRKQLQDEQRRIRETLLRQEIETTRARAEAVIAQTRAAMVEELERKNQELETFSYAVSHDLRAPLRSIDGFTLALSEGLGADVSESNARFVERIRAGVSRMTEMIDDLLELSRIGRSELRRTDVDLARLAGEILTDLLLGDPQRQVRTLIGEQLSASADPRLIRHVLENLLANAWKFTAKSADASIEVGSRQRPEGTVHFVRDNGAGFDMSRAARLFSPFQRLHSQSDFAGTGIGLATVQRIVDRHGGRIWAEAAPGLGATFWFTLPPAGPTRDER